MDLGIRRGTRGIYIPRFRAEYKRSMRQVQQSWREEQTPKRNGRTMGHQFPLRLSIPNSLPDPRSSSLKGSRILPVFARQSCVYRALIFCSSPSSAAVLLARAMNDECWASKVEVMAKARRQFMKQLGSQECKTYLEECIELVKQPKKVSFQ